MATYYTYDTATKQLVPAPEILADAETTIINPGPEEYAKANAYPRGEDVPPAPPEGKTAVPDGYELSDNAWVRTYRFDDLPLSDYDSAMEKHLYEERVARGYTTREPVTYLTSEVPRWAQDARDWVAHLDAMMEYALTLINEVKAGIRPRPSLEEFKAGLPRITWSYEEA